MPRRRARRRRPHRVAKGARRGAKRAVPAPLSYLQPGEKLEAHPTVEAAGFVTDKRRKITEDVANHKKEIEDLLGRKIEILSLEDWAKLQSQRAGLDEGEIGAKWVLAFAECLCQRRRDRAPIDEPTGLWVVELGEHAKSWEGPATASPSEP